MEEVGYGLDGASLLVCICGGRDWEVKWFAHVRAGPHRAALMKPQKVFCCPRCGSFVAARNVINRKESV